MCDELKPETLLGYPWVGQNVGRNRMGKIIENIHRPIFRTKFCFSQVVVSKLGIYSSSLVRN
jgi:hypothetical protein